MIVSYDGGGTDGAFNVRSSSRLARLYSFGVSFPFLPLSGLFEPIKSSVAGAGLFTPCTVRCALTAHPIGMRECASQTQWFIYAKCHLTGVHAPQPAGHGLSASRIVDSRRCAGNAEAGMRKQALRRSGKRRSRGLVWLCSLHLG